jgi:molybdopterin-containing oxidoreductase family iron-sulfur binding subunit
MDSLRGLADDMRAAKVQLLLIAGINPVYTAPADVDFLGALKNVPMRVALSRYNDETAGNCHWHLPELHYLESWGDIRAFDGSVSLIQPLIAPLYGGYTAVELISALIDEEPRSTHNILIDHWKKQRGEEGFDAFWRESLAEGFIAGSAFAAATPSYRGSVGNYTPATAGQDEMEIVFAPDPGIGNGEWTNNAWLMELARPLSKLTWDNAVIVGYGTAIDLGLENEDVVEISYNGRKVRGPVWVQPGHCPDTITVHLGFGRTRAGKVGNDMGFNAYTILTSDAPAIGRGAKITKLASKYPLARTEEHYNMEGRNLARRATAAEFAADPHRILHGEHGEIHSASDEETLYNLEEKQWHGHAWGMTIDLNQCTGCNACIIACQSENIIPVVGKFEVRKGREMAWIRVDRYYRADEAHKFKRLPESTQREILDNPQVYFQPVPCMQCENAPCENVCPVGATQHSREGLNDMVYNRCIGTRYCSNNCPYKVRRFNFYHYSKTPLGSRGAREHALNINWTHVNPETLRPMRNPDVTVRSRGVMEKCTYCVQRINLARIDSKRTGEPIKDGAIVTACQQACPSGAITFGDIKDPASAVHERKQSHRNYGILADLNTRPRTTYLARITNPNPELAQGGQTEGHA